MELARLGELYSLMQIQEIAGSIQLAGEHGARIRSSLAARAESLRYQQMSEVESSANAATERMGMPMVLLLISPLPFQLALALPFQLALALQSALS